MINKMKPWKKAEVADYYDRLSTDLVNLSVRLSTVADNLQKQEDQQISAAEVCDIFNLIEPLQDTVMAYSAVRLLPD